MDNLLMLLAGPGLCFILFTGSFTEKKRLGKAVENS